MILEDYGDDCLCYDVLMFLEDYSGDCLCYDVLMFWEAYGGDCLCYDISIFLEDYGGDCLYHILLCWHLARSGVRANNFSGESNWSHYSNGSTITA